jgi:hypothetical protein
MTQTSTGARVVFRVEGQKIAFANALNYTVTHAHQPIQVLDQLEPKEHAEVSYEVNFSATMFRVSNKSAMSLGIRPRLEDILIQPELTAELIDRITGATLMLIQRVKCTEESFSTAAGDVGTTTLSFVGIRQDDEGSL